MAKHIGIVACSAEGAALCYRTICQEAVKVMGDHTHPEITMHTYCLADYMNRIWQDDWEGVGRRLLASAHKLVGCGAEILICPDNTVHQALPLIRDELPARFIHIAEAVTQEALALGFARLGLLGTRYLMESQVYPQALAQAGIECEVPEERDRNRLDRVIFVELVNGMVSEDARRMIREVIERLKQDKGCDAAVLGCTELPLLIRPGEAALPVLDSTRLLARAALAAALE